MNFDYFLYFGKNILFYVNKFQKFKFTLAFYSFDFLMINYFKILIAPKSKSYVTINLV
jgi:hypothetical protein